MYKVYENQNLLDIAIQLYGNAQCAFALALANGLTITDDLVAGQLLQLPENLSFQNIAIANYYSQNAIKPATAEPLMILNEETVGFPLELPADY